MKAIPQLIRQFFVVSTKNTLTGIKSLKSLIVWETMQTLLTLIDILYLILNRKSMKPEYWQWFVVDLSAAIVGIAIIRIIKAFPGSRVYMGILAYVSFILSNMEAYIWIHNDSLLIGNVFFVWFFSMILFSDTISTMLLAMTLHILFLIYTLTIFLFRVKNDLQNIKQIILIKLTIYGFLITLLPIQTVMWQRYSNLVSLAENVEMAKNWKKLMKHIDVGILIESDGSTLFKNLYYSQLERVMNSAESKELLKGNEVKRCIDVNKSKFSVVKGNIVYMRKPSNIFYVHNITAIHQEEQEKCLQLLIATITHELRTPLNIMMAIFNQLKEDPTIPNKDPIRKGLISAELQESLINDILDISKINYGHLVINKAPTNIHKLLNDIYELFQYKIGPNVKFELDYFNLPKSTYSIDSRRFRQIVFNLLSNSAKFTRMGFIKIEAKLQEKNIICSVTDTGAGIALKDRGNIFSQFGKGTSHSEMNPQGTGLGLNLCKKLCNAMEGDIEFCSEVNIKTTFTFWIPIETSIEFSGNEIQEIALGGKNIKKGSVVLNVDDDPLNIYIMNNYAAKLEVKCYSFSHPLEAVEKISKLDLDIGVAFLDLNMPEMSGYETAIKLKQLLPDLVLIAVTGSDTNDVAVKCKSAGFDEILEKPLTFIKYSLYINKYIKAVN